MQKIIIISTVDDNWNFNSYPKQLVNEIHHVVYCPWILPGVKFQAITKCMNEHFYRRYISVIVLS